MKTLIIHGDDTIRSYQFLSNLIKKTKKNKWQIINIDSGKDTSFSESITQDSLFDKKRLYILKNYKYLNKSDLKWIKEKLNDFDGYLVVYQEGKIASQFIKSIKGDKKERLFELPVIVFKFLESFYPGNSKEALNILYGLKSNKPVEFIFTMLARHLKDLYWVSIDPSSIPYASWRVSKLEKQLIGFPDGKVESIIKQMSDLDIKVKTSKESLEESLDLLILQELE